MFHVANTHALPDGRAFAGEAAPNSSAAAPPRFRAFVRELSDADIEEQWRAHKAGFIAIASLPRHGLAPSQLYTIWLLNWADRFASAMCRSRAILESPEYHRAQTEVYNAHFMFMHCRQAHDILRNAGAASAEFTLEQIDQALASAVVDGSKRPA